MSVCLLAFRRHRASVFALFLVVLGPAVIMMMESFKTFFNN